MASVRSARHGFGLAVAVLPYQGWMPSIRSALSRARCSQFVGEFGFYGTATAGRLHAAISRTRSVCGGSVGSSGRAIGIRSAVDPGLGSKGHWHAGSNQYEGSFMADPRGADCDYARRTASKRGRFGHSVAAHSCDATDVPPPPHEPANLLIELRHLGLFAGSTRSGGAEDVRTACWRCSCSGVCGGDGRVARLKGTSSALGGVRLAG